MTGPPAMITPPDTTAAEKFRRGIGGHYDREVVGIAAAIASARIAEQERCKAIVRAELSDDLADDITKAIEGGAS